MRKIIAWLSASAFLFFSGLDIYLIIIDAVNGHCPDGRCSMGPWLFIFFTLPILMISSLLSLWLFTDKKPIKYILGGLILGLLMLWLFTAF